MLRILYLEDSETDAELLDVGLTHQHIEHEMQWVRNREQFKACLESGTFDVVLSDNGGPQFDGKAALALARGRHPEIPFIFLTGHDAGPAFKSLMELGADDVISKNDLSLLRNSITRAIENRLRRSTDNT